MDDLLQGHLQQGQLQQRQVQPLSLLQLWLQQDELRYNALTMCQQVMQQQGIDDWYISAGFVRNLIWDKLHGLAPQSLNDIDVIYWCDNNPSSAQDLAIQTMLSQRIDLPWSVKNQARMHIKNADKPYLSCIDAMSYWPEKQTAIGVNLTPVQGLPQSQWRLNVVSVFGLNCLFNLSLSRNPKRNSAVFNARVAQKSWLTRYPKLTLTA